MDTFRIHRGAKIMSVQWNTYGIKILSATNGREYKPFGVNPRMKPLLERLFRDWKAVGVVSVYTNGFVCNRTVRGGKSTSKHSEGLKSNGYKKWGDGTNGTLAFDFRKMLYDDGSALVVTNDHDRAFFIELFQIKGWKVLHKGTPGDPKVVPDHLHVQVK